MRTQLLFMLFFVGIIVFACKPRNTGESDTANADSAALLNDSTEDEEISGGFIGIKSHSAMQKDTLKLKGDPDYDFARLMKIHHKNGKALTNEEIKYGADTAMRSFAKSIQAEQDADLKILQDYLDNNQPSQASNDFLKDMKSNLDKAKTETDKTSGMSGNFDKDFTTLMALHHRQGQDIAKIELKYGKNTDMKKLAQKMVRQQETERKRLESYR